MTRIIFLVLSLFLFLPHSTAAGVDSKGAMHIGVKFGPSSIAKNPSGYGVYAGYTIFGSNTFNWSELISKASIAVEGEYVDLGGSSTDTSTEKASTYGVVGSATYPIDQMFSVVAKVGLASITQKYYSSCLISQCIFTTTSIGLHGGVAGQYNLSRQMVFRVGYDLYPDGFSMLSFNVVSKF